MKKIINVIMVIFSGILFTAVLYGCNRGGSSSSPTPTPTEVATYVYTTSSHAESSGFGYMNIYGVAAGKINLLGKVPLPSATFLRSALFSTTKKNLGKNKSDNENFTLVANELSADTVAVTAAGIATALSIYDIQIARLQDGSSALAVSSIDTQKALAVAPNPPATDLDSLWKLQAIYKFGGDNITQPLYATSVKLPSPANGGNGNITVLADNANKQLIICTGLAAMDGSCNNKIPYAAINPSFTSITSIGASSSGNSLQGMITLQLGASQKKGYGVINQTLNFDPVLGVTVGTAQMIIEHGNDGFNTMFNSYATPQGTIAISNVTESADNELRSTRKDLDGLNVALLEQDMLALSKEGTHSLAAQNGYASMSELVEQSQTAAYIHATSTPDGSRAMVAFNAAGLLSGAAWWNVDGAVDFKLLDGDQFAIQTFRSVGQ